MAGGISVIIVRRELWGGGGVGRLVFADALEFVEHFYNSLEQ